MLNISTIILTYNEQLHIERCIKNAQQFSNEIFLVDSFSTDKTVEIAETLGAKVFQNRWENNYAKQFNWGLQNLPIKTKWVLRLDADEYLTNELVAEVKKKLPNLDENVTGIILNREQNCFGKWVHPLKLLRIFQYRKAVCEQRWMDEHIQLLEGKSVEFQHKFRDHNLNTFGWWIEKHNAYSIREAVDLLDVELGLFEKNAQACHCVPRHDTESYPQSPENTGDSDFRQNDGIGKEAEAKRAKKLRYARSPLFKEYLQKGYYPMAKEDNLEIRLGQILNLTLEVDIPQFANLSVTTARKLKKLLIVIAESAPFKPNFVSLAAKLEVSRNSLEEYLTFMDDAGFIARLRDQSTGIIGLGKVEKVYLDNTNLIHYLSEKAPEAGNLRETFFLNQMRVNNAVVSSSAADFKIDKYTFEIGGKNKNQEQIKNTLNAFVVKDNIEYDYKNAVPLWAFGLNY